MGSPCGRPPWEVDCPAGHIPLRRISETEEFKALGPYGPQPPPLLPQLDKRDNPNPAENAAEGEINNKNQKRSFESNPTLKVGLFWLVQAV